MQQSGDRLTLNPSRKGADAGHGVRDLVVIGVGEVEAKDVDARVNQACDLLVGRDGWPSVTTILVSLLGTRALPSRI